MKTWRTVPMAFAPMACFAVHSLPGSAAIPPSSPLGGTPDQPDLAASVRSNKRRHTCAAAPRAGGARDTLPASRWRKPRSRQRADIRCSAGFSGGRSSRRGPSSPGRNRRDGRPASSAEQCVRCPSSRLFRLPKPSNHPLDIRVDRRRLLAKGNRGDRRRSVGSDPRQARNSAALSGKLPRLATSRAQAIRLRARA